jgi:hypothetical protein
LLGLALLRSSHHRLLTTRLAELVRADPLSLDGPGAEALVIGVIAGEMTMFDEPSAGVPAVEMDDLVLLAM